MRQRISPQEIYLLERFTSLNYFGEMRDTWTAMVKHVESCLESFMRNLPPDYRSARLPEQPDIVWGQRVLPNFRSTLQGLNAGFIELVHGNDNGFTWACGIESDFKGQLEYSHGWMSKNDQERYRQLLLDANTMAGNITTTEGAYWEPLTLSQHAAERGEPNLPTQLPTFQINKGVSVHAGEKARQCGIYVPDVDNSCAQYLSVRYDETPQADVLVGFEDLLHPNTGEKYGEQPIFEKKDCVWFLVERAADSSSTAEDQVANDVQLLRRAGGDPCPETGFYLTPSRPGSRRAFQKGEVFPSFDTAYGTTIWQWDPDQSVS
jgi:hypothetical protein